MTASIGIACAAGASLNSSQSLLERADQALYTAKQAGRNRLHVATTTGISLPAGS